MGQRIEWHAFMPHLEAVRRLVAADIAVYPYRDTNINRAKCSGKVIDYMAAGKPTVVSDVGMNRVYLTDGEHALLTPPGDGAAFAAALQKLLADPAYANDLGVLLRSDACGSPSPGEHVSPSLNSCTLWLEGMIQKRQAPPRLRRGGACRFWGMSTIAVFATASPRSLAAGEHPKRRPTRRRDVA